MIVRLYSSSDSFNKINKSMVLKSADIACNIKNDTSIMTPTISLTLPTNIRPTDFNYVYIDFFGYMYATTDIVKRMGGVYDVLLEIDVLYSFRNELNNLTVEVLRSESHGNPNILDNEVPLITSRIIEVQNVGEPFDLTKTKSYLCVSGG